MNLKPCPFCGGSAILVIDDHENSDTTRWHKIVCDNGFTCGAGLGTALSGWSPTYKKEVEELGERWNRRVTNV